MLVDLAYVLTVENDQAVRTEKKPTSKQFVQGRKQMAPGLEQALYGMTVGEEKDIVVPATQGFGAAKPSAVQTLPRKSVPSFAQATPGQTLRLLHKQSGEMRKAVVVDVQPDTIVLDFNHPLAGKTLYYHVRVEGLRPATPEEIAASQVKEKPAKQAA
jgi:FKBP-type peptidyl-prolyl cis-trans isomerase SlyD